VAERARRLAAVLLAWPLVRTLGCPCCGPGWYQAFMRWSYRLAGDPLPPELRVRCDDEDDDGAAPA
jgi:hypothetical protein